MKSAVVISLVGLALVGCAKSDDGLTCPPNVPASLAPKEPDQELVMVLRAEGIQRYACFAERGGPRYREQSLTVGGRTSVCDGETVASSRQLVSGVHHLPHAQITLP